MLKVFRYVKGINIFQRYSDLSKKIFRFGRFFGSTFVIRSCVKLTVIKFAYLRN